MKLHRLTLGNFQGIRALTLDFPDGRSASIYGDNATGKTTVYNALTWLLFDKASTAAKNFTPKTRSTDGDAHHLDHSAEGVFSTDDGRIVTLKKTFKEVYKKKRGSAQEEFSGHTVEYEIDGVPVKEKEFTSSVLAFCGGDTEKPKMLTMPDYFPEQLAWDTRRKILLEICGDISDDEIIAANPDLKELPDFLRMNGTAEQLMQGGVPVICMTMIDLLAKIKSSFDANENATEAEIMKLYEDIPLLVIDDIGSEQPTEWGSTRIYAIINARYEAYMPTIVTTNYTADELIRRMTPTFGGKLGDIRNAEKTLDRLREMCVGIEMYWDSWRAR